MGCFAKGCLTLLVLGFFLIAALGVGGWWFYKKTFNSLTSAGPSDVRIEAPTPEVIQKAESSKARLDQAIAKNEETTIELTGRAGCAALARSDRISSATAPASRSRFDHDRHAKWRSTSLLAGMKARFTAPSFQHVVIDESSCGHNPPKPTPRIPRLFIPLQQ